MSGASLLMKPEVDLRHDIGIETMMWGSDLPHREGTYPYTLEACVQYSPTSLLKKCRQCLGPSQLTFYRLDIDLLRGVADRIGPTVAEVAKPLSPTNGRGPLRTLCTLVFSVGRDWIRH